MNNKLTAEQIEDALNKINLKDDGLGTPKTLHEAMVRSLLQSSAVLMGPAEAEALARDMMPAVRDFLAQKMGCLTMSKIPIVADVSMEVWNSIFPPKGKR